MRKPVEIAKAPPRFFLGVRRVQDHGAGVFSLFLEPPPFAFVPGDCLSVFAADGLVSRPYSFASAPGAAETELLIRRIPGGRVSDELARLGPGDRVQVSPPFGWFRPQDPADAPKLWFATGTGIAPFLSAVRAGAPAPRRLFWGVRDAHDAVGVELFPGARLCVSPRRITEYLCEIESIPELHAHLCGLDRMIEEVASHLLRLGLPPSRIHREVFFTGLTFPQP